ncbi:alpha/beta fold hydrolase [Nocardia sp. NPDC004151]|uniref:alpha/beta fold hydrolase n=1 Tax=Nocardia sp. NPDC004151 TaxID=3364304 RepID=UPI0036793F98
MNWRRARVQPTTESRLNAVEHGIAREKRTPLISGHRSASFGFEWMSERKGLPTMSETQSTRSIELPDGTVAVVTTFRAENADDAPVVVVWPGIAASGARYSGLAAELSRQGCTVVVGELHGQGNSSPRPPRSSRYGMHDQVIYDYHLTTEYARDLAAGRPVYVLAHSFGGQLAVCHVARDQRVAGLILVASGLAPVSELRAVSTRRWLGARALFGLIARIGWLPATKMLGRPTRGLTTDIANLVLSGRFEPRGAEFDYEAAMGRSETPVLAINFAADRRVSIRETDLLVGKFGRAPLRREVIDSGLGHMSWLKSPQSVAEIAVEFIRELSAELPEKETRAVA